MMRVGIVGCGKMADQHARQIQRIPGATLAAVCDSEPLMALQMSERYGVGQSFTNVLEMLDRTPLDVVHIVTPPQTHCALAVASMKAGCHVYVEKPFTVTTAEAEELIRAAADTGRKITAGHNAQFTHAMRRMRQLVTSGYLGGRPVHMESLYCYDLGDPAYARAVLSDRDHWARRLPGSLVQNIISHGVSKLVEFLAGDNPKVLACGFTSKALRRAGEDDVVDEVRIVIEDEESTTAYFTFSSQMRPPLHQFRLYGPKNGLIVDDDHQTVLRLSAKEYKSYIRYVVPPVDYAGQYLRDVGNNVWKFLRGEFHLPYDAGLKTLLEAFYHSIENDTPPPLPYRDILVTARIMDAAFAQVTTRRSLAAG
jgi:predicted dehydrogenase